MVVTSQEEIMESRLCKRIKDAESESEVRIPQEITENILTRLPCKSLARCESVCKSWLSWITNPSFRRRDSQSVLLISTSSKGRFFQTITEQRTQTEKFPVPWADSKSEVHVSNSCNGIVLICVRNCFYLFNPSTHYSAKVLTLDYMSHHNQKERNYQMFIGLYYDEATSDYKAVVLIQYGILIANASAKILVEASLKEKRWNHIHHNHIESYCRIKVGPLVNGRLHWLNNGVIIRYNPVLKVFEKLPSFQPPQNRTNDRRIIGIGFLEGCLCVCSAVTGNGREILAMKEYGELESWTPIFSISNLYECNPLLLTRAGKLLISMTNEYFNESYIWVYNLRETPYVKYLTNVVSFKVSCAVSFVQNMDTPSGYYWNLSEHEKFGKTEDFKRIQKFWKQIY